MFLDFSKNCMSQVSPLMAALQNNQVGAQTMGKYVDHYESDNSETYEPTYYPTNKKQQPSEEASIHMSDHEEDTYTAEHFKNALLEDIRQQQTQLQL
jgi:conjugal transfer/entry exclusion protein